MKTIARKSIIDHLLIFIVTMAALAVPSHLLYINTDSIIVTESGKQATSVAITTAKFLEDDLSNYEKLVAVEDYSAGEYDQEYYQKMLGIFHKIKIDTDADYIYTEKKISDTEIVYILDGEEPGSKYFSPIGSVDALPEAESHAFNEGISGSSGLIRDPIWGVYITGVAPIRDPKSGAVISVVGVDFSSDHVLQILKTVQNFVIITWLVLSCLIYIIINRILQNRNKSVRTDYLTRLYTKQYLLKVLPDMIRRANALNQTFCLMMLDIDNFKEFNDQYGHLVGDRVLSEISQEIKHNVRDADLCFRYGGDEFTIILPDTQSDQALAVGNRIREYIQRNPIVLSEDGSDKRIITLSMGVAQWQKSTSISLLIEQADQAMYESKKQGRDRVTLYQPACEN